MPPKKRQGKKKARRDAEQQRRRDAQRERKLYNKQRAAIKWGGMEWKRDFTDFERQLRGIGLRIKDMTGDGNCLFRSIADQLEGKPDAHMDYRQLIVDYMVDHEDFFSPFCDESDPFPRHVADMRRNRTWGGNLELQAASQALAVNIIIHQLGEPRWEISNWEGGKEIHLSYHNGDHYSSVRSIGESDRGASSATVEIKSVEPSAPLEPTDIERVVMETTECSNLKLVREKLYENCGDLSATIAAVFGMMYDPEWHKEHQEPNTTTTTTTTKSHSHEPHGRHPRNGTSETRNARGRQRDRKARGTKESRKQTPEERFLELKGRIGKLSNKERKEFNRLRKTVDIPEEAPAQSSSCDGDGDDPVVDLGALSI